MKNLLWITLPVVLIVGCVSRNPESEVAYARFPAPALTPASGRPDARVYSAAPSDLTGVSTTASSSDLALGAAIRSMLMSERELAPAPSNVVTSVKDGVVTLRGTIATEKERQTLRDRIAALPGVVRVEDNLSVEWSH